MAVYRKGDRWMASIGAGTGRVRKTFLSESEALLWESQQGAAREAQKAPPVPTCWTLQQARDHTALHTWKGKGGERVALLNADQALVFFGSDTPTADIVATEIVRYMSHLIETGNGPSTRNKKMSALRVMLSNAADYGGLEALPKMKRTPEKMVDPAWFRSDVEDQMVATAKALGHPDLYAFVVIGIDTGFRTGELLMLTLDHYVDGALVLAAGTTKSGAPRRVPCSPRVKAVIELQRSLGQHKIIQLSRSTLRTQWEDMRTTLGKQDDPMFTPHKLRHTCATRMVSKGVNLKVVQAWLGHSVIATTMRYAFMSDGALDAAAETMFG